MSYKLRRRECCKKDMVGDKREICLIGPLGLEARRMVAGIKGYLCGHNWTGHELNW